MPKTPCTVRGGVTQTGLKSITQKKGDCKSVYALSIIVAAGLFTTHARGAKEIASLLNTTERNYHQWVEQEKWKGCWSLSVMKAFSVFNETLSPTPDNTFSPTHIASLNTFKKVVKERFDGFDFDARHDATSQDEPMAVADVFSDIYTAIELAES